MTVSTNNEARVALGGVLNAIHRLYANTDDIQGMFTDGIRSQFFVLLDQLRTYTEKTYNGLPLNGSALNATDKKKLEYIQSSATSLADDINESIGEFDFDIVDAVIEGVDKAISTATKLPGDVLGALIPWWVWVLLAVVAGVVVLGFLGKIPGVS